MLGDRRSDDEKPRSLRSARESIRWLFRTGRAYVDETGLKIPRDSVNPEALDVEEILERLEVLGVPDGTTTIAVRRKKGRAYFEIQINLTGLDYLAKIYPKELGPAVAELQGAAQQTDTDEPT